MKRIGVMQVVDTLETGGAERMAVNIANALPRERYRSYMCTTRREGPLEKLLAADVGRLRLRRRSRFERQAINRMADFIRANDIQVVHAHGASLFLAAMVSMKTRRGDMCVVWHDHFGRCETEERAAWPYWLATRRVAGVIAVNERLAGWSRRKLGIAAERVRYVPNFVSLSSKREAGDAPAPPLPGSAGARIVCVANFRPQKDHLNLIRAMAIVVRGAPDAHLLLVGQTSDDAHCKAIRAEIAAQGLQRHVSFLGQRGDVAEVLRGCDIGVLASSSEGLPLSLLEYGAAGLPAVTTRVGQCAEVLDEGKAGVLVAPSAAGDLAEALAELLASAERRADLGARLRERVAAEYGAESAMRRIGEVYEASLATRGRDGEKRAQSAALDTGDAKCEAELYAQLAGSATKANVRNAE
jgi:glycosyltransferase involved in cell wall biosynthesis